MPVAETDSPSHAHKRPRLEETEGHDELTWTRHPTLYMQDGTIVLVAKDTVFRVYSGLLSKHSEVFSGMCSLSSHQPSDAETYDGCPLVRLFDDPGDMGYFLNVLHDFNFFPDINHPASFALVSGTLRLATKYMVQPLREKAIAHLSRAYSSQFDTFMKHDNIELEIFGETDKPHPFELVAILRECRVDQLLPQAFILACNLGFDALLLGHSVRGKPIHLSPDDTRVALLGWQSLRESVSAQVFALQETVPPRCDSEHCDHTERISVPIRLLRHIHRHRDLNLTLPWHKARILGVCGPCVDALESKYQDGVRGIWQAVPQRFGLPSWEQLKDKS